MILTRAWLHEIAYGNGATWTREQLSLLGVSWPPRKGWVKALVGREILDTLAEALVRAAKPKTESIPVSLPLVSDCRFSVDKGLSRGSVFERALGTFERAIRKQRRDERKRSGALKYRGQQQTVDVNSQAFLASYDWRRLRMVILTKRGAQCECCGATPQDGVRMHVDHIKARRTHPQLALDESNLQVLCEPCNHGKGNDEKDWRQVAINEGRSEDVLAVKQNS